MNAQQAQANVLIQTAQELQSQGRYDEAIALYEKAIDLFPAYGSYNFLIGDMHFELGRYAEAARAYWALLQTVPEHAQAWSSLGQCLLLLNQVSQASEAFGYAVEIDEELAEAWYYGAMAHSYLGQSQEAKRYLRRALNLRPDWEMSARNEPLLEKYLA